MSSGIINPQRLEILLKGIGVAEGFFAKPLPPTFLPNRPQANNNPGNIYWRNPTTRKYELRAYPSPQDGWAALRNLITDAFYRKNLLGRNSGTWREFAWMYVNGTKPDDKVVWESDRRSGGPDQWLRNVIKTISSPSSPILPTGAWRDWLV